MAPPNIFISYRRLHGEDKGNHILTYLRQHKYTVFFDRETLTAGPFPDQIESAVKNCTHFILLLTKGSLDRCVEPGDWLRKEIALALSDVQRTIIPIETEDFKCEVELPSDMKDILTYQRIGWSLQYVPATLEKIKAEIQRTSGSETTSETLDSSDFRLSDCDLLKIGDIIQKTPRISQYWPLIARQLLGLDRHGFDVQGARDVDQWIADTLEHWIAKKGDDATLNKLIDSLVERKIKLASDNLRRRREEMRKTLV